jgi:hypothetical protein
MNRTDGQGDRCAIYAEIVVVRYPTEKTPSGQVP